MIRTWGLQTLTGAAQPWFGDALTAAVPAQPANVNNYQNPTRIKVASTTKYRVGDYLILGAGTATADLCSVTQIPDATTLVVSGAIQAHANGALISLSLLCINVVIQNTSSGNIYLGADNTVTAVPGGSVFAELFIQGVFNYADVNFQSMRSSDGWLIGAAASTYLAYIVV